MMTCPPQVAFVPKYGPKQNTLGGDLAADHFKGGAAVATKMQNWGFWCLFFVWRFSEWAVFGDRNGPSQMCRSELELSTEQFGLYFEGGGFGGE